MIGGIHSPASQAMAQVVRQAARPVQQNIRNATPMLNLATQKFSGASVLFSRPSRPTSPITSVKDQPSGLASLASSVRGFLHSRNIITTSGLPPENATLLGYHGTSRESAFNIMANGVKPEKSGEVWGKGTLGHGFYGTPNRRVATDYAKVATSPGGTFGYLEIHLKNTGTLPETATIDEYARDNSVAEKVDMIVAKANEEFVITPKGQSNPEVEFTVVMPGYGGPAGGQ